MLLAATLLVMVAYRVWSRTGRRRAQPVIGPLAAAGLVLLGGLGGLGAGEVGLVLSGFWYAVGGAVAIAAGYGVAAFFPRFFPAEVPAHPVRDALAGVPLATVAFEEVAFRGVLWALIARDHGPVAATAVTAVLFGVWHLSPDPGSLGEVAFTTLAGVALGALRHFSGGLLAPFVVHWTANGLGILVSARMRRPGTAGPPPAPKPPSAAR